MRDIEAIGRIRERLLSFILILVISYGLIVKLLIARSIWLHSDSVLLGRLSFDFWMHKNFLLGEWHLASTAPYIFTEWVPFILIPQILSDFNPSTVRLMSFVIYTMVIVVFALLVYMLTNNITNSLIFSALMANINPESSIFYLTSASHVGALFFTGLFLIITLKLLDRKRANFIKLSFIFLILVNLMVFSDSIILAWFVIPTTLYYFIFFKNKNLKLNELVFLMFASSAFTYIIKTHFISDFINNDPSISFSYDNFLRNILLYVNGLSVHIYGGSELSIMKCAIIASYLILIYFTIKEFLKAKDEKEVYIYHALILSAFLILIAYICTSYAADINSAIRYLLFTFISISILVSLCDIKNRLVILSFIMILSFGIASEYHYVSKINLDANPNQNEFELLDYLNSQDLKYGYGDYWDANILTYLSKENIIITPVWIEKGQLVPFKLHSPERLFDLNYGTNSKFFLLSRADNTILKKNDVDRFIGSFEPEKILYFKNFNIYVYSNDMLYSIISNGDMPTYNFLIDNDVGVKLFDKTVEKYVFYSDKLFNKSGFLVYGPFIILPKGIYDIQFTLKADNISNTSQKIATLDVLSSYIKKGATKGSIVNSRRDLFASDLTSGKYLSFNLTLNVTLDDKTRLIEFRVFQYLVSNLYVEKLNVYKLN